jgi:hypothetical protein
MNQETRLPWADRDQHGIFVTSIQTVLRGLVFPSRTLVIGRDTPPGRTFFNYAFGIWCCIPMTLLSLIMILAKGTNPDAFHFQDLNPFTTLIAIPLQMVVGPFVIWVFGWSLVGGLRAVSAASAELRETVRNLGWYLGTILLFVVYTWLGTMVPLYSIRAWARNIDPEEILIGVTLFVGIVALIRTGVSSIKATFATSWLKAILGLAITVTIFMLAGLPVVIVCKVILAIAMS